MLAPRGAHQGEINYAVPSATAAAVFFAFLVFFLPFFFFRFLFFFLGGAFVDPDAFPSTGAAETEFWGAFSASSSVIDSAAECCAAAMNDVDREVYARITGLGVQKSARIQSCE